MATEHITVVDPDQGAGYDYASLSLWESDFGDTTGNLPSDDLIAIAKCRSTGGTADATAVAIDGWTTDATRYIKVWTDSAESYRHDGKWNTGKYRISLSSGGTGALTIGDNYVRVIGLQLNNTSADRGAGIAFTGEFANGANLVTISHCIFKGVTDTEAWALLTGGIFTVNAANDNLNLHIYNNVFYDYKCANDYTGAMVLRMWYGSAKVYANTIHDCRLGIVQGGDSTVTVKDMLFDGCTTDATGTITDTYCATSNDNTKGLNASGTGNRFSQTFSFVDGNNGDFHLTVSDSGARDYGTGLSGDTPAISDDIDGVTRTGTWDIGADEYVAEGGGTLPLKHPFLRPFSGPFGRF